MKEKKELTKLEQSFLEKALRYTIACGYCDFAEKNNIEHSAPSEVVDELKQELIELSVAIKTEQKQ